MKEIVICRQDPGYLRKLRADVREENGGPAELERSLLPV